MTYSIQSFRTDPSAWAGCASALFDCADRDDRTITKVVRGSHSSLASFAASNLWRCWPTCRHADMATMFRYVPGVRVKVFWFA